MAMGAMAMADPETVRQVCTITIVFPVESDEQAVTVKQQLSAVTATLADVRTDFRIMTVPVRNV